MRGKKPVDYNKLCYVLADVVQNGAPLPSFRTIKSFVFKQQLTKRRLLGLDEALIKDAYLEIRKHFYKIDKEVPDYLDEAYKEAEKATEEVKRMGRYDLNASLENGAGESQLFNSDNNINKNKEGLL